MFLHSITVDASVLRSVVYRFVYIFFSLPLMAVKLSSFTISKRIPKWVNQNAFISSLSCANSIQKDPETDQSSPKATDFEAKIQFLSHKLYPDTLIQVLDRTHDLNSAVRIFKWAALQKRFNHTVDSYYWMILKLGLAGRVKEMEELCQNMMKDRCPGVEQAIVLLIDSFVNQSRLDEAVRVLVHMNSGGYKASVDVFNVVLGAVVKEKRGFEDVLFVYKEMVRAGVAPNLDTLNYLLEALFESNRAESALDQFRRLSNKGCIPNSRTFEIVVRGLIEKNYVDDSVKILHEMFELGCQPDLSFFNCIIPLFCRENKLDEIARLFSMMRASNFVLDLVVYGELISCLCKNLWLDDASNILQEMMKYDLTPTANVFVDIVNGLCKVRKFDEAMKLLEDKCSHLTSPYNVLLECYCNSGKIFTAKILLEKMSERKTADCHSWNVLLRWICENVGIKKANELLGRMIISSISPDCSTYSALVIGNCRLSKYEDALKLFHRVHATFSALDSLSYSKLVEGLCQVGRIKEAADIFCYMSSNGCSLQSSLFNSLIKSLCGTGKVDDPIKLLWWAFNTGTSCTNATYSILMNGLFNSKRYRDLLVVLSQMLIRGYTLDVEAYCILIRSMIAENRTEDCALFFKLMVCECLLPNLETVYDLLSYLASHSQLHTVSIAIDKLISNGEILNSRMYNLLIYGLWKEGFNSEACRLLDLMLEKGWVPDSMTHQLLIGSFPTEEAERGTFSYSTLQDNVTDILAEGLGKT
ncbi:PPR domain-containing protein/PPR_2 domain-containing protein/PPR_3 domain-containing protein [Cephalotus follicularis]|uniref:PPR domain-containing protein/PPR_2 domain-containing protein/PPR_3 domain-containing protein n=1 Tax=Cephalotus follicularis TaxID=3775 RepID=A0A1Q3BKH2_CEPFO|nr:PPR domain-containing protein/PPR_2 domain-containing protein/PPR_3 domain-containing protein [Cephalotus follicularis]